MYFVPVTPPPPSPRAQELGRRLKETIESFRREHPDVSGTELRQAMGLATSGSSGGPQAIMIGVLVGLLALAFLAFFFFLR